MASHNGAQWIQEQVESILSQTNVNVSLHVFDDCSTDNTELQLRTITRHHSRTEIHRYEQASGSAGLAFMRAFTRISINEFDFVALADQDDIWPNNKLSRAVERLTAAPLAAGYSCSAVAFWASGKTQLLRQSSNVRLLDYLFEGAGQGCTFVIRAPFFSTIQPLFAKHQSLFNEFHYHDWLLYLLARSHGHNWVFDEHPYILYRQHEKNELGARGTRSALHKRLNLVRKGWYRSQVTTALRIAGLFAKSNEVSEFLSFSQIFFRDQSIVRRLRIAQMALLHGRRRITERVFVALCSLAGWL
jgi:rhamnosyltransferase